MPPVWREQRKSRKAQLQSLLIRMYGDRLNVQVDPTRPEVVGLVDASGSLGATDAVVADLDGAAQGWVRIRIDAAVAESAARPPSREVPASDPT
jgi:hypothetical protein